MTIQTYPTRQQYAHHTPVFPNAPKRLGESETTKCPHCGRISAFDSSSGEVHCDRCGTSGPPDYEKPRTPRTWDGDLASLRLTRAKIEDLAAESQEPTAGILREVLYILDDLTSAMAALEDVLSDHPLTLTQAIRLLVQMQEHAREEPTAPESYTDQLADFIDAASALRESSHALSAFLEQLANFSEAAESLHQSTQLVLHNIH